MGEALVFIPRRRARGGRGVSHESPNCSRLVLAIRGSKAVTRRNAELRGLYPCLVCSTDEARRLDALRQAAATTPLSWAEAARAPMNGAGGPSFNGKTRGDGERFPVIREATR